MATVDEQLSTPSSSATAEAEAEAEGLSTNTPPGSSLAHLPIIDLPHRWAEHGELMAGTSPEACPRCKWSGKPEHLFDRVLAFRGEDRQNFNEPFKCAACEIMRSALTVARDRYRAPSTSSSAMMSNIVVVHYGGLRDKAHWATFISARAPQSDIDRYKIARRDISKDHQLSPTSSAWAQERITECVRSHTHCQSQSDDSFLPTRLIQLHSDGKGLNLRLADHQSVPPGSRYVALSYCWGGHKPSCMTTSERLKANTVSLDWNGLPRTFQDAAKFTFSLGINYLWIDSICIIQGDKEDWQREAGKMCAVYQNSYLTLAALAGSDSTYGLRTTSVEQVSVPFARLRLAENTYTLYMRRLHYFGRQWIILSDTRSGRLPLLSRAWTFQERIVSPRVMFFTESEMIYECLGGVQCECGDAQSDQSQSTKRKIYMATRACSSNAAALSVGKSPSVTLIDNGMSASVVSNNLTGMINVDKEARDIAETWRLQVVVNYAPLSFSVPRDRLPALGALAEQFQRVRVGEDYLAGLWSGSLLQDLLWYCGSIRPKSPLNKDKDTLQRPFSLPTWSWASLQSYKSHISTPDAPAYKATVVEAHCTYAEGNSFGILENSKLVLRGRILACTLEWCPYEEDLYPRLCFKDEKVWRLVADPRVPDKWCLDTDIRMDRDQDGCQTAPLHQQVYILEIVRKGYTHHLYPFEGWQFLILRREGEDEHIYTRGGIMTCRSPSPNHERTHALPQEPDGTFESFFEAHSVMTTCEIR